MTTRMLIDARHPEETRVAVLKGNRIDEFDFDSADHKQIKGNIYLAKVTRVEPSLQAAFVDFGGNRHGFLAFGEIHPDYYQIPREDREALLAEEAAHAEEEAALRAAEDGDEDFLDDIPDDSHSYDDGEDDDDRDEDARFTEVDTSEKDDVATIEAGHVDGQDEAGDDADNGNGGTQRRGRRRQGSGQGRGDQRRGGRAKQADDLRDKRMALRRRYKIQDVIHRRQVLLVQVNKEERGNKGAALTTYLSLAGRYCVLMPNSSHGGGISRKISSVADRKRLKSIIVEMDLPKTMGCIVRTAGLARTKPEIKRDFDYLARLWDGIRETTLGSSAPALIHSDSDLIKRAIRDIYNSEIEDIVVEGEAGYRAARDFMKLLMPSHAKRVKAYIDPVPLFQRYGAEDQLAALYEPEVQLKSGGYLVINPTEALVSIDINSGRSTKEHGIEATAVNTNLEAAREIARQLRLRDMAGLVVIDFIDMEHGSNVRKVEKAMKDALKEDRARIQVGRISSFGLMEMSRQRLRTGVLEATTRFCPHCDGTGLVRTAASSGLAALRLIEEEAARGKGVVVTLFASQEASIYLLNAKRADLADIEARYGVTVEVIPEGENEGAKMRVVSSGPRNDFAPRLETIALDEEDEPVEDEYYDDEDADAEGGRDGDAGRERQGGDDEAGRTRKRRKRRRGRTRDERDDGAAQLQGDAGSEAGQDDTDGDDATEPGDTAGDDGDMSAEGQRKRRRRRSRRRGGRGRDDVGAAETGEAQDAPLPADEDAGTAEAPEAEPAAKPKRTRRTKAQIAEEAAAGAAVADAVSEGAGEAEATAVAAEAVPAAARPKRGRTRKTAEAEAVAGETVDTVAEPAAEAAAKAKPAKSPAKPRASRAKKADAAAPENNDTPAPAAEPRGEPASDLEGAGGEQRRGWWQRTFGE